MFNTYKQQIQYLFFGILTTGMNIIIYYLAFHVFTLTNVLSTILAWVGSVIFAYLTNRKWVFDSSSHTTNKIIQEFSEFIMARLITGVLDVGIMWIGVDIFKIEGIIIKVIANVIVIVANYFLSKKWVFK